MLAVLRRFATIAFEIIGVRLDGDVRGARAAAVAASVRRLAVDERVRSEDHVSVDGRDACSFAIKFTIV